MAHALSGYDGPCRNIHGHTYTLSVTVRGRVIHNPDNPKNGMVLDFSFIKHIVREQILETFDHALVLNSESADHRAIADSILEQNGKLVNASFQPTCENMLLRFAELLQPFFKSDLELLQMKLVETPTSYAEWFLEDNI